jgi:hypothetical protein
MFPYLEPRKSFEGLWELLWSSLDGSRQPSRDVMEDNGREWNGMEWNGMEWNGMEWNGMTLNIKRSNGMK